MLVSGQDRRVVASASRLASAHGLRVAATFTKPFRGSDLRACLAAQKSVLSDTDTARARRRSPTIRRERIEQALRTREIVVYYQPQVAIDTLEWVGVETLVRWQHPQLGLLSPSTFVPIVEREPDLMYQLSQHVIRAACHEMVPPAAGSWCGGRTRAPAA